MQLGRSEEIIFFIRWLNVHCDSGGSQLGPNGAADNPRVPARSPGLAPRALTRPPTGPITRGKTNKGSYYTLLMKDTRGEGGARWSPPEQKSTDRPLLHHHRHRSSPHTLTSTQNNPRLRPSRTHAFVVRDSRGSVEVGRGRGASWPVN